MKQQPANGARTFRVDETGLAFLVREDGNKALRHAIPIRFANDGRGFPIHDAAWIERRSWQSQIHVRRAQDDKTTASPINKSRTRKAIGQAAGGGIKTEEPGPSIFKFVAFKNSAGGRRREIKIKCTVAPTS